MSARTVSNISNHYPTIGAAKDVALHDTDSNGDDDEDEGKNEDEDDHDHNLDDNAPQGQNTSDGSRSMHSELGLRGPSDVDMVSVDQRGSKDEWGERHSSEGSAEQAPPHLRGTETFVEHYPVPTVGTPIQEVGVDELQKQHCDHTDVGPFTDEELFQLVEILNGTPWNNNRKMLRDVDLFLPCGPKWRVKTFEVAGSKGVEHADFWFRDGLQGILHLLADLQFTNDMVYKPTKVYVDPEHKVRVYSETTSANRMWSLQVRLISKHRK
ncbi:hypothetical protein FRC10_003478 [Ceratobasidium sp. 414]|nr:hypothetical protein FRC10_003478 [Ceratobasidium sp. 414]